MNQLSKLEGLVALGLIAFIGWGMYKAAKEASQVGVRAYNALGETVQNTRDNAVNGVSYGLSGIFGDNPVVDPTSTAPVYVDANGNYTSTKPTTSASAMADYISGTQPSIGDMELGTWSAPPNFVEAGKRMTKPSYGRLSQPSSDYPQ